MRTLERGLRRALWVAPAAALIIAGCDANRTSIFDPVGPPAYDFNVSPSATWVPGGSLARSTTGGDSTVTLTVTGLSTLSGSVYQFWGVSKTGAATPLFATVAETDTAGTVDTIAAAGASTYAGSGTAASVTITIRQSDAAQTVNPYLQHAIVVSIEGAAATTPGTAKFLWRRVGSQGTGSLFFGNFGGADTTVTGASAVSTTDFRFVPTGTGRAAVRGPEFSVDLVQLARPPVGFIYRGWLVNDAGAGTLVDELRSGYSSDASASRVSLANADTDASLPQVVGGAILSAQVRNCVSGSATLNCDNSLSLTGSHPFAVFGSFRLQLTPKAAGSGMTRNVILEGTIPEVVRDTTGT